LIFLKSTSSIQNLLMFYCKAMFQIKVQKGFPRDPHHLPFFDA